MENVNARESVGLDAEWGTGTIPMVNEREVRTRIARHMIIAIVALIAACAAIACWRYLPAVCAWLLDAQAVRAFVADHAVTSRFVMVGINITQVLLAFLPGEPIELASGYAFGFWEGTLLCLIASAIATSAIYLAVRRWGWHVVGLFFDRKDFQKYGWLQDARRLELLMLVVFLIPGTPKDFLTYFAGLTRMRFPAVLAIATLGRIPSIVTSTAAASAFGSGNYALALAAVVVAAILLALGAFIWRTLEARRGC